MTIKYPKATSMIFIAAFDKYKEITYNPMLKKKLVVYMSYIPACFKVCLYYKLMNKKRENQLISVFMILI